MDFTPRKEETIALVSIFLLFHSCPLIGAWTHSRGPDSSIRNDPPGAM